jgi:hypothetical protein
LEIGVPPGFAAPKESTLLGDVRLVASIGAPISSDFPGNGAAVASRFPGDLKDGFPFSPHMGDYVPLTFGDLLILHGCPLVVVNRKVADGRQVTLKDVALNSRKRAARSDPSSATPSE